MTHFPSAGVIRLSLGCEICNLVRMGKYFVLHRDPVYRAGSRVCWALKWTSVLIGFYTIRIVFCSECKSLLTCLYFCSTLWVNGNMMKSWAGLPDFPVIQNSWRPKFSSVEKVSASDFSHRSSQNIVFHIFTQEMAAEVMSLPVCVCVCRQPDMNGVSGCSRLAEHAQVNFTVCNTLDSLYMCCSVHLHVHSALFVRHFQVLVRSVGVFHLNRISKWK